MVENLSRIRRSRRKELERERGRILSHNIRDVHDSKSIFVRAATFGQLTKHIFDHGGGSHPNSKNLCQHGIQDLLISGKAEGKLSLCRSRHTFAFVLLTVIPSGPTLLPIEQNCSHRAVTADDALLNQLNQFQLIEIKARWRRRERGSQSHLWV